MTDGHRSLDQQKLGQQLVSEQDDGWSQNVLQKLGHISVRTMDPEQVDECPQHVEQHWRDTWVCNQLTGRNNGSLGQVVGSQVGQEMQTNHVWSRHGSVQDRSASTASSNTRVQVSLGRGSWSTVLDSWQVLCVPKDTEDKPINDLRMSSP